jgi:hypothetical protein
VSFNGCMCRMVREWQREQGIPEHPPEWRCLACQGRQRSAASGRRCRSCGVGLLTGESDDDLCTDCDADERARVRR